MGEKNSKTKIKFFNSKHFPYDYGWFPASSDPDRHRYMRKSWKVYQTKTHQSICV